MLVRNVSLQTFPDFFKNFSRLKVGRALASVSEKLSTLDVGDKLKNMEKRLTYVVAQKVGEAMKTTREKVE